MGHGSNLTTVVFGSPLIKKKKKEKKQGHGSAHQRSVRLRCRLKIIFSLFIPHYSEEFPPTCFSGKFQLWGAAGKQRCWMEATAICWSCWWGVQRRIREFKMRRKQWNIKQLCTLSPTLAQKMISLLPPLFFLLLNTQLFDSFFSLLMVLQAA